jgi:hypothetical protein
MIADPATIRTATITDLRAKADLARTRLDPHRKPDLDWWGSMLHDIAVAPSVPARRLLAEIGIGADANLSDIINGLAAWGTYLLHTDHLDDCALLTALQPILDEPVPMHGAKHCAEFIDLNPLGNPERRADRDRSLPHPSWSTK